ncbi:MAG: UDP-N-acetylglucosamine--N-acetylmuramyl-(pentapeptide) pyrophosphoryl-undecaprenol N-acetylglucosamine transferase [Verrucomicrobia bacterium]|nr:UDP-N-acetylglucosamine--N-acetylmuramyl-(pentapeptide) pyrophosphoryl-undecaprenol N-acetylglucosamine transferase [Verrucomicrobiota bacterium]
MTKTVVISAGGSGGHLLLAQKIGRALKDSYRVIYMGVHLHNNKFLYEKEDAISVEGANFSKGVWQGLKEIGKGCKEARSSLGRLKADHVIGLGSFHSLPPLCAAFYLGIPFSLVEPNIYPGKVNRFLAAFAKKTFIQFPGAKEYLPGKTCQVTLEEKRKTASKKEARAFFGLNENTPTLLIFGGSQGADAINKLALSAIESLPKPLQVLHFTGSETNLKEEYDRCGIPSFVTPFCQEMELAWTAADIAICRAGASSIAELLFYEVPSLLIPFPKAMDDHQTKNARYVESFGAVFVEAEHEMTKEKFCDKVSELLKNQEEMQETIKFHKGIIEAPPLIEAIKGIL